MQLNEPGGFTRPVLWSAGGRWLSRATRLAHPELVVAHQTLELTNQRLDGLVILLRQLLPDPVITVVGVLAVGFQALELAVQSGEHIIRLVADWGAYTLALLGGVHRGHRHTLRTSSGVPLTIQVSLLLTTAASPS